MQLPAPSYQSVSASLLPAPDTQCAHNIFRLDTGYWVPATEYRVRCQQPALARLDILKSHVKIFDQQLSHPRRHPAILVSMIVHRNALPNLPADGHQFVEVRFVDQDARVVLPVPAQIGRETGFFDGHLPEQGKDLLLFIEGRCGKRAKIPDQVVDGEPRRCFQLIHGCIRQTIEYTVCGRERSCP